MQEKRKKRRVDGILLLDKPLGLSSNAALQKVKWLFGAEKAGHTGSLDPLASGLLPICLGEATKFSQLLLDSDKCYLTTLRLGVATTTGDAEGEVVAQKPVPVLDEAAIDAVLERFRGDIEQVPSMYSALKRDGRPLYELARAGVEVERAARPVHIYRLELKAHRSEEWDILVHCSKGTYVRSLVEDIGACVGCGAHVIHLHRIAAGPFDASGMHSLSSLQALFEAEGSQALDRWLLPAESSVVYLPRVELSEQSAYYLRLGQAVRVAGAPHLGDVALFAAESGFLGVGKMMGDGRVAPRRLIRTSA